MKSFAKWLPGGYPGISNAFMAKEIFKRVVHETAKLHSATPSIPVVNTPKNYFKNSLQRLSGYPSGYPRLPAQLPLIPPGLAQEMLGGCARCDQDEWVHRAYWRATVGADHEFQPKEEP